MKRTFVIFAILCGVFFGGRASAVTMSCLDSCDKFSGDKFKACMERCRVSVSGEKLAPMPGPVVEKVPPINVPGGSLPVVEKQPPIKTIPAPNVPKEKPAAAKAGECPDGMVKINAGEFNMGCGATDINCGDDESPAKKVKITKAFCLDKTEVTQAQYKKVTGENPSDNKDCGADCPAETVSWEAADAYCKKAGKRLPTEAEWEYAARAGADSVYYWGDSFDENYAWSEDNSNNSLQKAGQKEANAFGLYDTVGNVWEWTQDCYDDKWYSKMPDADPVNKADKCDSHVLRGGSWNDTDSWLRASNRAGIAAGEAHSVDGVRCAADLK